MREKLPKDDVFLEFVRKYEYFLRFVFVGTINTIFDLGIYGLLANIFGLHPIPASLISTSITLVISYMLNNYFVFRSQKNKSETVHLFVAATLFNVWLVQSLVIALLVHVFRSISFFDEHKSTLNMFAKLGGVGVSLFFNYFSYRYIFNSPSKAKNNDSEE